MLRVFRRGAGSRAWLAAAAVLAAGAWSLDAAATEKAGAGEGAPRSEEPAIQDAAHENPYLIENTKTIGLPGEPWGARVALPGFEILTKFTRLDGSGVTFTARNRGTRVTVTLELHHEAEPVTSIECRGKYFPADLSKVLLRKHVRRWRKGSYAMGEYVGVLKPGSEIPHMHVHGYMGRDDVCLTLHVHKVPYAKQDRPLLDAVFDSLEITGDGS